MLEEYKIKPEGFKEIKKKMIIVMTPLMLLAIGAGFGMSFFNPSGQEMQYDSFPLFILFVLGVTIFGLYKAINRQRILFESYRLIISENEVRREQFNTPTISILHSDIHSIVKNANGGLTIRGRTNQDIFGVPSQIDNLEQLEQSLNHIKAVTYASTSIGLKYLFLVAILTLGSMVTVYTATNKILVGFAGTIVTTILVWGFIETQRSKNLDTKTKRGSYLVIIVLISIISITIMKITAE